MLRRSVMFTMLAATVLSLALGTSGAAPAIGSPLVGAFCSAGGPILGSGSTFASNAVNLEFIPAYNKACGKGTISYSPTGSGAGIIAARDRTAAWGGTEDPLSADQIAEIAGDTGDPNAPNPQARVSPIHTIPVAVGAVTVSYDLASCGIGQEQLQLRSPVISAIFAGVVTKWNDQTLTLENPSLASCNKAIKLAVRSDVSGTTFAFKDYLAKRNPFWAAYRTPQFNTSWPAEDLGLNIPIRASGNGGVAAAVKATDGAIGYVEYSTAKKNGLTWAKVDGASGQFNSPADGSGGANCALAALGAVHPASTLSPGWDQVSITDTPNPLAYAVCTLTYALVFQNLKTAYNGGLSQAQAQTLVDFLGMALEDSTQATLASHGYSALPVSLQTVARAGLASITYE